jgi:hypothetical protein
MTGTRAELADRRLALLGRNATFNGVDYAEAHSAQGVTGPETAKTITFRIDVHFINRVRVMGTLERGRPPVTLTVSGGGAVPVACPVVGDEDWSTDTSGRPVLRVSADLPAAPGRYLLTVHSDRVDPCLASAAITVFGDAIDRGDGEAATAGDRLGEPPVQVDYLAKDFASFLVALSNFSAARYPLWAERSEADFGVMLMEVLSALADELSYLQDRVAAEATIGTATQRLSLVRHVRLVDYEPMPALAATAVLQFDVAPAEPGRAALPDLIQVQALGGQAGTVDFAAGPVFGGPVFGAPRFAGPVTGPPGPRRGLDARWNRYDRAGRVPQLVPYQWDPGVTCLRRGAASMWVDGHGHGFYPGQELLIDTATAGREPPSREIVRVTGAEERTDPVHGRPVTHLRWLDGLASDHDLTRTELAGNLLPCVQGQVTDELFAIPGDVQPSAVPLATVRADHSGSPARCLYTLAGPVAWQAMPAEDGGRPRPRPVLTVREIAPTELAATGPASGGLAGSAAPATWRWVPRLVDAGETARAFTVTPERYSPAASAAGASFSDYDGDGATLRFGDGTFGRPPAPGTTFRARYLAGGGEAGNVAADTIVAVAPGDPANGLVWRCTNPFPATGGAGAESSAQIRDRAPRQVRSGVLSLTGPADYQAAARSFSVEGAGGPAWARQAIAAVRWTGSWLSTVTVADPLAAGSGDAQLVALAGLAGLLDARRLAGADTSVALARYRWLDLRITCAARPGHRPGDVAATVLARLAPRPGADGTTGFFGRDQWAFGQPLETSALMAAVQSCPGVAGVTRADYRWAGSPGEWRPLRATLGIAPGEILRTDNDPGEPGHGLLFVTAEAIR